MRFALTTIFAAIFVVAAGTADKGHAAVTTSMTQQVPFDFKDIMSSGDDGLVTAIGDVKFNQLSPLVGTLTKVTYGVMTFEFDRNVEYTIPANDTPADKEIALQFASSVEIKPYDGSTANVTQIDVNGGVTQAFFPLPAGAPEANTQNKAVLAIDNLFTMGTGDESFFVGEGTVDLRFTGLIDFVDPTPAKGEIQHIQGTAYVTYDYEVIPIPAAFPLFATALAGLGFVSWRRRRTA